MAKLIYSAGISLDGYVADESGNFDWTAPDQEAATFINNRERQVGTYLFGRKVYEAMRVWETPEELPPLSPSILEYVPIWQAAEKIIYSTTLPTLTTAKTRLERKFDPDAVRKLKASAARTISIGGPTFAAHVIRAGLVDEYNVTIVPIIVGGGNPYLPRDVHVHLELIDERRFSNGMVHLTYRAKR